MFRKKQQQRKTKFSTHKKPKLLEYFENIFKQQQQKYNGMFNMLCLGRTRKKWCIIKTEEKYK